MWKQGGAERSKVSITDYSPSQINESVQVGIVDLSSFFPGPQILFVVKNGLNR